MRWFICLTVLASMAGANPADRDSKAFSLFSVVTFPNSECVTAMSPSMMGVCKTQSECTESKGSASGNCASGFGVCCYHSVSTCSSEVTNNLTYITNSGYPTGFTTVSTNCAYTVKPKNSADICQLRIDFDNGVLNGPTSATDHGNCEDGASDQFKVTSPVRAWSGFTALCGTLTGSHMYVETGREATAATINVNTGTGTATRTWKLKVTMIECDNPMKAPTDCLQYFTGVGGKITSYNNGGSQMIQNLQYFNCIRQEKGYCGFQLQQASTATSPDTFNLQNGGTDAVAETGTDCDDAFLLIEDTETSAQADRYCGDVLSTTRTNTVPGVVRSFRVPFRIGVVSKDATNTDLQNADIFEVIYTQIPC